jgi:hypothetical protein
VYYAGVQSAAVSVVCELARKNPKNYLPLAPMFFKLMTTSTNNWMLIKIIKLVRGRSFGGKSSKLSGRNHLVCFLFSFLVSSEP